MDLQTVFVKNKLLMKFSLTRFLLLPIFISFFLQITTIFWPATVVRKMGELTEIQLYDTERTLKVVQNTKIKPFAKLRKLPANRNKYWKEAYGLACKDIDG